MTRVCGDCQAVLRRVETNFLKNGRVWETGFAPVEIEAWACPQCGQLRFFAIDAEQLFSQQEPTIIPLTLKEAYGEVLDTAIEWSPNVQLCAVYSGGDDEAAYVDAQGLCALWSFTFCDQHGQYLDLVLLGQEVEHSPYEFDGETGAPFELADLLDSPELIRRAIDGGLSGENFTLVLERNDQGVLQAIVVNESENQLAIDPAISE